MTDFFFFRHVTKDKLGEPIACTRGAGAGTQNSTSGTARWGPGTQHGRQAADRGPDATA